MNCKKKPLNVGKTGIFLPERLMLFLK